MSTWPCWIAAGIALAAEPLTFRYEPAPFSAQALLLQTGVRVGPDEVKAARSTRLGRLTFWRRHEPGRETWCLLVGQSVRSQLTTDAPVELPLDSKCVEGTHTDEGWEIRQTDDDADALTAEERQEAEELFAGPASADLWAALLMSRSWTVGEVVPVGQVQSEVVGRDLVLTLRGVEERWHTETARFDVAFRTNPASDKLPSIPLEGSLWIDLATARILRLAVSGRAIDHSVGGTPASFLFQMDRSYAYQTFADQLTDVELGIPLGHRDEEVVALAPTPDGRWLVALVEDADGERSVLFHSITHLERHQLERRAADDAIGIAVSPASGGVALAGPLGSVQTFLLSHDNITPFGAALPLGTESTVTALGYAQQYPAVGLDDGQVAIANAGYKKWLDLFQAHDGAVRAVSWEPSERLLVTAGDDQLLRRWKVEFLCENPTAWCKGERVDREELQPVKTRGVARGLSVGPGWMVWSDDKGVRRWTAAAGKVETLRQHTGFTVRPDGILENPPAELHGGSLKAIPHTTMWARTNGRDLALFDPERLDQPIRLDAWTPQLLGATVAEVGFDIPGFFAVARTGTDQLQVLSAIPGLLVADAAAPMEPPGGVACDLSSARDGPLLALQCHDGMQGALALMRGDNGSVGLEMRARRSVDLGRAEDGALATGHGGGIEVLDVGEDQALTTRWFADGLYQDAVWTAAGPVALTQDGQLVGLTDKGARATWAVAVPGFVSVGGVGVGATELVGHRAAGVVVVRNTVAAVDQPYHPHVRYTRVFDAATGTRLPDLQPQWFPDDHCDLDGSGTLYACGSADGEVLVWDVPTGLPRAEWRAHTAPILTVRFAGESSELLTASRDGTLGVWAADSGGSLASWFRNAAGRELLFHSNGSYRDLHSVGRILTQADGSSLTWLGDGYFSGSPRIVDRLTLKRNGAVEGFRALDPWMNRPDLVVERFGGESETRDQYAAMVAARKRKLGTSMGSRSDERPTLVWSRPPPLEADDAPLLSLTARGPATRLVVALDGVRVEERTFRKPILRDSEMELRVQPILRRGLNRFEAWIETEDGLPSPVVSATVHRPGLAEPSVYVLAVGVSDYVLEDLMLEYPDDDAADLVGALAEAGPRGRVHTEALTGRVTRDDVLQGMAFLEQATEEDVVVLFLAGHGFLVDDGRFAFGTSNVDPADPASTGLLLDEIEQRVSSLRSRQRLVLIDACHAGEPSPADSGDSNGTEETGGFAAAVVDATNARVRQRSFRGLGRVVKANEADNSSLQAAALFADLEYDMGAFVVGAAGASEFAWENGELENGVFTAGVLTALGGAGDANRDGSISASELADFVATWVPEQTDGKQHPAVRERPPSLDFLLGRVVP